MSDYPEYPSFPGASLDHWLTTPPDETDPDEGQCRGCDRWMDQGDLDEDWLCARCETAITRECEGCGQRKPVEEMSTAFLPGTGETYQCEQCRGVP